MSTAATEFIRLVEIVARLRAPDGCPWDREQTIDTLKPFVLEETYEVLEAIDRHDHAALCEELGDFLFEAVFLAQLEAEAGHFTIADSMRSIADKLVRRHPHVFARDQGEAALDTAGQVRTRWEEIKAQERGGAEEADDAARRDPADAAGAAARVSDRRARRLGRLRLDQSRAMWSTRSRRRSTNCGRWWRTASPIDRDRAEEEMGDLLFAIANLVAQARHRARDRAAQGERQVHPPLRSDGAIDRIDPGGR